MIEFAGIRSDERYLIVEHYPQRYFPKRKYVVQKIPGRSGDIVLPESETGFENYTQPYSVFIDSKAPGLSQASRGLAEWLLGNPGYQRLEDSYDPDFYRMAYYSGGEQFLNWFNEYGQGTLTFNCAPQRFYKSGEKPISIASSGTKLYSPSTFKASPIIKFHATGNVTLYITEGTSVQKQFKINNLPNSGDIVIDVDRHSAILTNNGTQTDINSKVASDYEILMLPQECTISWGANVSNLEVTPRWWTI